MEETSQISYTIGLNLNVVKHYTGMGYTYFDALNRYVIPLDIDGYSKLLVEECPIDIVGNWCNSISLNSVVLPVKNINPHMLSDKYYNSVKPYFRLLPNKDSQFWEWRYINNKGFSYIFFEHKGNVVITRIEAVHDSTNVHRHGLKSLRLIEILPNNGNIWCGEKDIELNNLLKGVLSWAKEKGCVLADFQISNTRIEHILIEIGFRKQENLKTTNVFRLLAPLRNVNPLNFTYRINITNDLMEIDKNDIYFLKSDCDMDRPNWLN